MFFHNERRGGFPPRKLLGGRRIAGRGPLRCPMIKRNMIAS